MAAVSDSSPLIVFERIGQLSLLREVFGELFIPPAVAREVFATRHRREDTSAITEATWIRVRPLRHAVERTPATGSLGQGELEAIALGSELGRRFPLLMDDRTARRSARQRGLAVVGSAGALLVAKEMKVIPTVQDYLRQMRVVGLYVSDTLFQQILALAGELLPPECEG